MKYPKIEMPESFTDKLLKAGLLVAAFVLGKKMLTKKAQDNADNQIDKDPAAGQARALNAAMNPSGISWMREFDTTNTDAIWDIAAQITNLDKVKDFYKAQTKGRILHEDLTKELSAEDYNKFLALATKGKTGAIKYSPVRNDIPTNQYVVTKLESNIRSTPKLESKYLPGNNIVKLVPANYVLGLSTGKFAYDEKNDVTFIEFMTFESKTMKRIYFYVAKSQIEFLTTAQKEKRDKPTKLPTAVIKGLSGTDVYLNTEAVTKVPAAIYDERFKQIGIVARNIIVGFPLMQIDTKKGRFTKVKTVQGKIRWVNSQDIIIQKR